jgi:hypothetical protein
MHTLAASHYLQRLAQINPDAFTSRRRGCYEFLVIRLMMKIYEQFF